MTTLPGFGVRRRSASPTLRVGRSHGQVRYDSARGRRSGLDQLRSLFNNPDRVRVQQLPCELPGLDSLAVHFGPGARTVPHQHRVGQHLVFVDGVGVVADEGGVHVVRTR